MLLDGLQNQLPAKKALLHSSDMSERAGTTDLIISGDPNADADRRDWVQVTKVRACQ